MTNKSNTGTVSRLILLLCFSIVMLSLFSVSSPFNNKASFDSSIFTLIGRAWAKDIIPYRDIFDHKGPALFFIQMIIMSISQSKWCLMLANAVNMTAALEIIWRTGLVLKADVLRNIIAVATFTFLTIACCCTSNSCEEWSLPWILYPLYTAIRYATGDTKKILKRAALCGLCFGVVSQIRVNNAGIIAGVCIGIAGLMIWRRQYSLLLKITGTFIGTTILSVIPFVIYFASQGAFQDYFYSTVTFCIKYRAGWQSGPIEIMHRLLRPGFICCYIACVMSVLYDCKRNTLISLFIIPAAAISVIAFLYGVNYLHYDIVMLPFCAVAILLCYSKRAIDTAAITILCSANYIPLVYDLIYNTYFNYRYTTELRYRPELNSIFERRQLITSRIPEEDLDSVYVLCAENSSDPDPLFETGHIPVGKYTSQQIEFSRLDPITAADITNSFAKARPKWIITNSKPLSEIPPISQFSSQYEPVDSFPAETCFITVCTTKLYRRIEH